MDKKQEERIINALKVLTGTDLPNWQENIEEGIAICEAELLEYEDEETEALHAIHSLTTEDIELLQSGKVKLKLILEFNENIGRLQ